MAVTMRLSRGGAKKRPFYRIVVADKRAPRDGKYIERLGTFNPLLPKDHEDRLKMVEDRIKYWLSVGAKPSDRVARFLGEAKIIPMPAQRNNPEKAKPKAKAQERAAEKIEKAKAAKEAANAPAPEEEAAAPVPATEVAEATTPEEVSQEVPAETPAEEPAERPAEAPAEQPAEAPQPQDAEAEAPAAEATEEKKDA